MRVLKNNILNDDSEDYYE